MMERVKRLHGELEVMSEAKGTQIQAVIPINFTQSKSECDDNVVRVRGNRA
jgi:signal transduction histidine kinase